ncbi:hypothetical protein TNCV_4249081 [Trichonephila clavipes]|nr:hypothetical protein TNCV_4249081 [Trichonephila clavipes]
MSRVTCVNCVTPMKKLTPFIWHTAMHLALDPCGEDIGRLDTTISAPHGSRMLSGKWRRPNLTAAHGHIFLISEKFGCLTHSMLRCVLVMCPMAAYTITLSASPHEDTECKRLTRVLLGTFRHVVAVVVSNPRLSSNAR